MIKRRELADRSSCLSRAANNEPLFVLRAHDELASSAVRHWAQMYRRSKLAEGGRMTASQLAKHEGALALADAMDQWRLQQ